MDNEKFRRDLSKGHEGEAKVLVALQAANCEAMARNGGSARDLVAHIHGNWWWIEVKNELGYDENARNICIETRQNSGIETTNGRLLKWSGINVSESQVFIHILGGKVAIYRKEAMRWHLRQLEAEGFSHVRVTGDNGNRSFLVPVNSLLQFPWFELCDLGAMHLSRVWAWQSRN